MGDDMTSLQAIAARAERVVLDPREDEKQKRAAISALRRGIDLARQESEDVSDLVALLERLETKFRADLSDQEMRSAASYASKRAALLSSKESQHRKEVLGRADLLLQSKDATESLVRTRDLMVKEIARANEVSSVLLADSEKLRDVGGQYTDYDASLKTARGMLKNMQRRENTDRLLLAFGFLFFLLVVAYILKRRLMPFFSPFAWLIEKVSVFVATTSTTETTSPDLNKEL